MATVLVQAQLTTEQLLDAIGRLDGPELESLTRRALQLQAQSRAEHKFRRETELLEVIYRKKSAAFRRRFDRLNAKRRAFTLTAEEHQELLRLVDEAGAFDVERVRALSELAELRRIPLETLMRDLGLKALKYV